MPNLSPSDRRHLLVADTIYAIDAGSEDKYDTLKGTSCRDNTSKKNTSLHCSTSVLSFVIVPIRSVLRYMICMNTRCSPI